MTSLQAVSWIMFVSLLTIASQALLKHGLTAVGSGTDVATLVVSLRSAALRGDFLLGLLLAGAGFVLWLYVISRVDLTFAFPISGAVFYLALFVVSGLFLGENVTGLRVLGAVTILLGSVLLIRSG